MNKVSEFLEQHAKGIKAVAVGLLAAAAIVFVVGLVVYNTQGPILVYNPDVACNLLTFKEAKSLLGDATVNGNATTPVVSGNTATSTCAYSDGKNDATDTVAAISVRAAINDTGVAQIKANFATAKKGQQSVSNVGDQAFFNAKLGQLNILVGHDWIIESYGLGSAPQNNTIVDAVKLAQKVLH